jgi:hypothetical protein
MARRSGRDGDSPIPAQPFGPRVSGRLSGVARTANSPDPPALPAALCPGSQTRPQGVPPAGGPLRPGHDALRPERNARSTPAVDGDRASPRTTAHRVLEPDREGGRAQPAPCSAAPGQPTGVRPQRVRFRSSGGPPPGRPRWPRAGSYSWPLTDDTALPGPMTRPCSVRSSGPLRSCRARGHRLRRRSHRGTDVGCDLGVRSCRLPPSAC